MERIPFSEITITNLDVSGSTVTATWLMKTERVTTASTLLQSVSHDIHTISIEGVRRLPGYTSLPPFTQVEAELYLDENERAMLNDLFERIQRRIAGVINGNS